MAKNYKREHTTSDGGGYVDRIYEDDNVKKTERIALSRFLGQPIMAGKISTTVENKKTGKSHTTRHK